MSQLLGKGLLVLIVLLVYPEPPAHLDERAKEFLETESQLPANVVLVVDRADGLRQ